MNSESKNPPAKSTARQGLRPWPNIFDEFFKDWSTNKLANYPGKEFFPDMDLVEKKKEYLLKLDVPGIAEENLEIEVNNRVLSLSGRSEEEVRDPEDKELVRERRVTSFSRSFTVPEDVDAGGIEATYRKGVLEVKLPKAKEAVANSRKITIK